MAAKSHRKYGGAAANQSMFAGFVAFIAVFAYIAMKRAKYHILLLLGTFCVLFAATGHIGSSLTMAALIVAVYLFFTRHAGSEGFSNEEEEADVGSEEDEKKPKRKESSGKKEKAAPAPPDHGDRADMFQLGTKYKMPSEADDSDFHLDAGTTFMNAYKALKPDQIAAMTKDTQELMETQKQLMSTLHTLKPLITDGKQMMEMFQSYFGSGNPTPN